MSIFSTIEELIEETKTIEPNSVETLLGKLDHSKIGEYVYHRNSISDDNLISICAMLRRKIKPAEIIIMDCFDDEEEQGIIFTPKEIVYWYDSGEFFVKIPYEAIQDADFDSETVKLVVEDDMIFYNKSKDSYSNDISIGEDEIELYTGDDYDEEGYSKFMYMYIMDICEWIKDNQEHIVED